MTENPEKRVSGETEAFIQDILSTAVVLAMVSAVVSGVLASLLWRDVNIHYGCLLGASAALTKTVFMARDARRMAREGISRAPGSLVVSFIIFGVAFIAAGLLSRTALIAAAFPLAIPYASAIIAATHGRSGGDSDN